MNRKNKMDFEQIPSFMHSFKAVVHAFIFCMYLNSRQIKYALYERYITNEWTPIGLPTNLTACCLYVRYSVGSV